MNTATDVIVMVLGMNAFAAFASAFFYQAKLICRLLADSNAGVGIGDGNSIQANLYRFFAGEIYPDLRPRWMKAVGWVIVSVLILFVFGGLTQLLR